MKGKVRISRRVRAALGGVLTAGILVGGAGVQEAEAANFIKSDLDFILTQIKISEQHAQGGALFAPDNPLTPDVETGLVVHPTLPYGLRTVDGRDNNILPGQREFGAADTIFPRLTTPLWRSADVFDQDGPGPLPPAQTNYEQTSGVVADGEPRKVSNLIVDQTSRNPAATAAFNDNPRPDKGTVPDNDPDSDLYQIPNVATDEGLSASYNSWFTFFGQFFDHGLDLVTKGGSGDVIVPLQTDDPLISIHNIPPSRRFIPLTRATNQPGGDEQLGTGDDVHDHTNTTTPFVDQNQTYTSHPSHQAFLRQHVRRGGVTVATGKFLDDVHGGLATWADIKAQAESMLGIQLRDQDVLDVPLIRTDPYGRMIPNSVNGMAQIGTGDKANPTWVAATGGPLPGNTVRTGHAFLDDIAHSAAPKYDHDNNPATPKIDATADNDVPPAVNPPGPPLPPGVYDDELLAEHFITGDGRGNENIGLTTVHFVFHAEHNRLADEVKRLALSGAQQDPSAARGLAFLNEWLATPLGAIPPVGTPIGHASLVWNGERVFQAARFGTEMQYQHLVFEEFARKIQPEVNVFAGYHTEIDPKIAAEFAHTVYRFGHSMLNEDVPRVNADGTPNDLGLIEAFLNPVEFDEDYANPGAAAGAVVTGTTRQVGNELDEFITGALRNNLLGLPLDLATFNLARGRDTGIPGLNAARRQFFADTGHPVLTPYESWADFGLALRYGEPSLVNFIAAYGTHPTITAATTNAARRWAAQALVSGTDQDSRDFMNSAGIYAPDGTAPADDDGVTRTGLGNVDFWVGGLAEKQMPFGGLLGSTFNFVFETQMERLQDGDRFYYLSRNAGLNFITQLEENSFAELIMSHTNAKHLPFDVFSRPDFLVEANDDTTWPAGKVVQSPNGALRFVGGEHIVFGGTPGVDRLRTDDGDDTVWGDGGGDRIEGGAGNDALNGNDGDDVITDTFGIDNIKGGAGNDAISVGTGTGDLTLAGAGHDFVVQGDDEKEVFLGGGDDFVRGSLGIDTIFGNEGDDWIEGGSQADLLQGGNGDPFQSDGQTDPLFPTAPPKHTGNDVIIGDGGNDDYDSEGGDDIMVTGPGIERNEGMLGFDWVTATRDPQPSQMDMRFTGLMPPDVDAIRDRFDLVEGLSGYNQNDVLRGDDRDGTPPPPPAPGAPPAVDGTFVDHELDTPEQIALISGLGTLLGDAGRTSVADGNILLGGGGSDVIEGRGGNDIIDGDRWLDVRVTAPGAPAAGFPNVASLEARVFQDTNTRLNPGDIEILRQIKGAPTGDAGIDMVVFSEPRANYDIDTSVPGRVIVDHVRGGGVAGTAGIDGRDTLINVEVLNFAGQQVVIGDIPNNQPPTGTVDVTDTGTGTVDGTPTEDQSLTAVRAFNDPDGVNVASIAFEWEIENTLNGNDWAPVAGGTGPVFTPGDGEVGKRLRVIARFFDNAGVPSQVTSGPTAPVANLNDTPTGAPALSRTDARVGRPLTVTEGNIADNDNLPADGTYTEEYQFHWQRQNTDGSWTTFFTGASYTPTVDDQANNRVLRVLAEFTDRRGTLEQVPSVETSPVRDGGGAGGVGRLLVLGRAIVPGTATAQSVLRAGIPVTINTPTGANVLRIRVFAGRAAKPTARVFLKLKGGKTNQKLSLNHKRIVQVLSRGGTFRIELTPGASETDLGTPTVRTVSVRKGKK